MQEEGTVKITGMWSPKKTGKTEALLSVNIYNYLNFNMVCIVKGADGKKWVNFPAWRTDSKIYHPYFSFDSMTVQEEIKNEILRLYEELLAAENNKIGAK